MVTFQFKWHKKENKSYRPTVERTNLITISNARGDIKGSAYMALQVFKKSFGSLKKNEIVSIYPLNKDGEPFGDPITLKELEEN